MKNSVLCFLVLILILGCKDDGQLAFEPLEFTSEKCADCPEITISIPKALHKDALSEAINTAVREEVISMLDYDDTLEASTITEAMQSFKNGYLDIKQHFQDEAIGWEAIIEGKVTYEDPHLITLQINTYTFTGGAHGFSSIRFLNFDKKKAVELDNTQLFSNQEALALYAERQFRKQEQIPETDSINATGFMFYGDSFYLPDTIGLTTEGLEMIYAPYEIASYADGPIRLILPFKEVQPYLNYELGS